MSRSNNSGKPEIVRDIHLVVAEETQRRSPLYSGIKPAFCEWPLKHSERQCEISQSKALAFVFSSLTTDQSVLESQLLLALHAPCKTILLSVYILCIWHYFSQFYIFCCKNFRSCKIFLVCLQLLFDLCSIMIQI